MSNDATHINICNLMGITYIVYWSGHFSRKAVSTFVLSLASISVQEKVELRVSISDQCKIFELKQCFPLTFTHNYALL